DTVMSYVIDLYAQDLKAHPSGVDRDTAYFDKSGYYALARHDAEGVPLDRQVDIFGGLRWRFEEHIPKLRQRTDRVSFFRATAGLQMLPDRSFNNPEYNTFSCPWHNNLSAAIDDLRFIELVEGAGHWLQVEQPGKTNELILRFLHGL
ncbi:MAG: hypothetical protein NWR52_09040, partial [Paracoccaceae bacterium]|nr:hypothetical protein [Paracoccaceae bacterium]